MDAITNIDIGNLHTKIADAIKAQFPALKTVEFYSLIRSNLAMPACLLELEEMDAATDEADPGTEQLAVTARFSARVIVGFRDNSYQAKLEVRTLAAALAAWIHKGRQRWTLPVGPATVTGLFQDDFAPELDQFEVWRVEWEQIIHLGNTVWDNAGLTHPTTVYALQGIPQGGPLDQPVQVAP